jgi:DNA-directed RNA polymerase specialized sigma24 family protein
MVSTNCIPVFIRYNDSEFRALVTSICNSLNYQGSYEEIIAELYEKICDSPILQSFNRHYYRGVASNKMSTYLYPIIRNHVISRLKSPEHKIFQSIAYSPSYDSEETNDMDHVLSNNNIAPDYEELLLHNAEVDQVDGLRLELQDFARRYLHQSKSRRGKKSLSKKSSCTLLDIYNYLYEGYSNKEIADIYEVSQMSVSHYKNKLAKALLKYGFTVSPRRKRKVCDDSDNDMSEM